MTVIAIFILSPWLLFFFYTITIQYQRGGAWGLLSLMGLVTVPMDVVFNYTSFALLMQDFPQKGEYTFSSRLERLVLRDDWRGKFALQIATCLNAFCPMHSHIKNAVGKAL